MRAALAGRNPAARAPRGRGARTAARGEEVRAGLSAGARSRRRNSRFHAARASVKHPRRASSSGTQRHKVARYRTFAGSRSSPSTIHTKPSGNSMSSVDLPMSRIAARNLDEAGSVEAGSVNTVTRPSCRKMTAE